VFLILCERNTIIFVAWTIYTVNDNRRCRLFYAYRNRFHIIIGIVTYRAIHVMIYTDRRKIHVPVGRATTFYEPYRLFLYYYIYIYIRVYIKYSYTWPLRDDDDCPTAWCNGQRRYFKRVAFSFTGKVSPNKNALSKIIASSVLSTWFRYTT